MKIPYNGQMVEAEEVETITSKEDWNEYQMANGDILMVKVVLVRALKSSEVKLPDGSPFYSVNTQCLVKVKGGLDVR